MRLAPVALFAVLSVPVAGYATPTVIVYQQLAAVEDDRDPNIAVQASMAQQLNEARKVRAVAWGSEDRLFQQWKAAGQAPNSKAPSITELQTVARAVKADYILVVTGVKSDGAANGGAMLYRPSGARPVWTDTKQFKAQVDGVADWQSAGMTLANTWRILLDQGPFKGLQASALPADDAPVTPRHDPVQPPVDPKNNDPVLPDKTMVLTSIQALMRQGLVTEAIVSLRRSIDTNPLEPEYRRLLVQLLLARGLRAEAADEAQRFASLSVANREFLLLAAEVWVELGDPSQAQSLLNDLRAREGNTALSQLAQAKVYLALDDMVKAEAAFRESIKLSPSFEAAMGLATLAAMQGNEPQMSQSMAEAGGLKPRDYDNTYRWAMAAIDRRMVTVSDMARDALQHATGRPRTPEAIAKATKLQAIAKGLAGFMRGVQPPSAHQKSHDLRRLAQDLLMQATSELANFASSGDSDMGAEATLSLGEALQYFARIREAMDQEFGGK